MYRFSCFPSGSDGKESACNRQDPGSIPGMGRSPGEGNGYLFQYSCLGKSHEHRCLASYKPYGHKELDMTEWLTLPVVTVHHTTLGRGYAVSIAHCCGKKSLFVSSSNASSLTISK